MVIIINQREMDVKIFDDVAMKWTARLVWDSLWLAQTRFEKADAALTFKSSGVAIATSVMALSSPKVL